MSLGVEFGFRRPQWMGFKSLDASDGIRTGAVVSMTAICLLLWPLSDADRQQTPNYALLAALWVGAVAAGLFRSHQIWARLHSALAVNPSRRTRSNEKIIAQGLKELFVYLLLSLLALSVLAFVSGSPLISELEHIRLRGSDAERSLLHIAIYCAFFAGAFLPILTAIARMAAAEAKQSKSPLFRTDVVSRNSLITSFIAIGGILLLAWAAGAGFFSIDQDLGVIIYLVVIIAFLVFIIAPHLTRHLNQNEENRTARASTAAGGIASFAPEVWVSRLDSILVRLVAPLSGATQHGAPVPHLLVVGLILPLSAIGFVLSSPFGLIPIFVAMLIVIALGRRWAWVEADRETASRLQSTDFRKSQDIHIGFDNDLKDEALLGYVSFFVLVPLALFQIEQFSFAFDTEQSLASMPPTQQFYAWISFFGAELAKAVPFVDWWEIYQVEVNTPISVSDNVGNPTLAKHLTFAARALVDLVIMAALFQAFGIWQRSRAQQRLYDAGHINAFDPFTEQEFFERGIRYDHNEKTYIPKPSFRKRVEKHREAREELKLPAFPYSPRRLSELLNSPDPDLKAGAEWMVSEYRVLAGPPAEQLSQLEEQWRQPCDFRELYTQYRATSHPQRRAAAKNTIRNEKLKFERLLDDLIEAGANNNKWFALNQANTLLKLLEHISNLPEFVYAHSLAIDYLSERRGQFILLALASHTLTDNADSVAPAWRRQIEGKFNRVPNVVLGRSEMRQIVYDAMERYADLCFAWREISRIEETMSFLELMAQTDAAAPARLKAGTIANQLRNRLTDLLSTTTPNTTRTP